MKNDNISQVINKFRFLPRLSVICSFRRDCPRPFASCREYLREKRLLTETVRVILLPASRGQSRQEAIYHGHNLGRKQEVADSLGGSQTDGQSGQEAKIGGLVFTL